MQEYGSVFAAVYDKRWTGFARDYSPLIFDYFESLVAVNPAMDRSVLDLCCGTGRLSAYFLERGWRVVGIDLSPHMVSRARKNCERSGDRAQFYVGDASSFSLERPVSFCVSLFDALNHLESLERLSSCFLSVRSALSPGGVMVFDLNTRKGLKRWNGVNVQDDDEVTLINHGVYAEEMGRAYTKIVGFLRNEAGSWDKFDETMFNTAFPMEGVATALRESGFRRVSYSDGKDLAENKADPEELSRAFVVAAS